jgi:sugar phosphate permease
MSAPDAPVSIPDETFPKRPSRIRYGVLAGLALAAAGAYLTRVSLATAATTVQRDFGFSDPAMGAILAAFSAGYFWCQVPGGWAANRWGARLVMPIISIAWSLCSLWTGLAGSFAALWASRMGAGLAQAGLVPAAAKVVIDWSPTAGRGSASAVVACSMSAGAVIAGALTAVLLPVLGWRGVFMAYSTVGIVWAIAFYLGFRNRPEEHPGVNRAELGLIRGPLAEAAPGSEAAAPEGPKESRLAANWKLVAAMATSPSMALICAQAFCRAFGAAFFITWFPAFLERSRGVEVSQAGLFAVLPLVGTLLGNMLGGVVVDRLLLRTGNKRLSRSGTAAFALTLCGLCTLAAVWVKEPLPAVAVLALGSLFFGLGSPAAWAATMDISGRHTAVVFGIMNMSGNLGALVCPIIVGYLFAYIQKNAADWNLVLFLFVGVNLAGALCWAALNPNRSAVGPLTS